MPFVNSDAPIKSKKIILRLNEHEDIALRLASAEEGLTKSDRLMAHALNGEPARACESLRNLQLISNQVGETDEQLARITNNLNQLLRYRSRFGLFASEAEVIFDEIEKTEAVCVGYIKAVRSTGVNASGVEDALYAPGKIQFVMRAYESERMRAQEMARANSMNVNGLFRSFIHRSHWFACLPQASDDEKVLGEIGEATAKLKAAGVQLNETAHTVRSDMASIDIDLMLLFVRTLNGMAPNLEAIASMSDRARLLASRWSVNQARGQVGCDKVRQAP